MTITFDTNQFLSIVGTRIEGWWLTITTPSGSREGYATLTPTGFSLVNDDTSVTHFVPFHRAETIEVTR